MTKGQITQILEALISGSNLYFAMGLIFTIIGLILLASGVVIAIKLKYGGNVSDISDQRGTRLNNPGEGSRNGNNDEERKANNTRDRRNARVNTTYRNLGDADRLKIAERNLLLGGADARTRHGNLRERDRNANTNNENKNER